MFILSLLNHCLVMIDTCIFKWTRVWLVLGPTVCLDRKPQHLFYKMKIIIYCRIEIRGLMFARYDYYGLKFGVLIMSCREPDAISSTGHAAVVFGLQRFLIAICSVSQTQFNGKT